MRIPSGKTDQTIFFVAYDSSDHTTRKTGLSSFTVYRSRNGGTATVYTTPTVTELSSSNMPGTYALLIDEDTTIASGSDSEEYCAHITATGMDPVTRTVELYRRDTTTGNQLLVDSGGRVDVIKVAGTTQTAGDIIGDTNDIQARLPAALVSGRIDASVGAMASGVLTATAIAADAITDAKVASDVTIASVTGAVGSVIGAVGSVTGLTASDVGAIKAKTDNLPSDPADASDIAGAFSTVNSTLATIAGYVDTEVAAIKAKTDLIPASPAAIGDAMTLTVAYDAAKTAASQTSVDDLPTNAELTTALDGADDATLAAIAALPTTSTVMSADITKVNGVTVNGDGAGTPWGP